jgi:uncharacterized protein YjbI with pentapeptide repeats
MMSQWVGADAPGLDQLTALDEVEVGKILKAGESQRVEFKLGIPTDDDIARVLAAFSNTEGGILILGITDDGVPHGVDVERAEGAAERARNLISPTPDALIQRISIDGASLVVVQVMRSPATTTLDGRVFVRSGERVKYRARAALREFSLPAPTDSMDPDEKGALLVQYVKANAKVVGLDFSRVRLPSNSNLFGSNLKGIVLEHASLDGVDLTRCDLRGAHISHARMTAASLRGSLLEGAELRHVDLRDADLHEAKLHRADLRYAHLRDANLQAADLQDVLLAGAILQDTRLNGAVLRGAEVDDETYRGSQWNATLFAELVSRGVRVVNLHLLPSDARMVLLGGGNGPGLTLTFDTRLHRFDGTALDFLIAEVLGRDTDVTIEERSNVHAEGPSFIRINGSCADDLIAVAEAFYDRVWRSAEAVVDERVQKAMSSSIEVLLTRLDGMRDCLRKVEANVAVLGDEDVQEAIMDKAQEHVAAKWKKTFQSRMQRIAEGLATGVPKKLIGTFLGETVADVAGDLVGEVFGKALGAAGEAAVEPVLEVSMEGVAKANRSSDERDRDR